MYSGLIHTLRYAHLAGNPAAIPRARLEASFTVMYKTFVAELTEAARFGTGSEMRALLDRLEARVQIGRQADAAAAAPAAAALEAALAAARAAPLSPAVAAQVAALQAALDAERATLHGAVPALLRAMESLLVVACEAANLDVVRVLLARGASTDNTVDGKGDAALAIACSKGHLNLVKALLAANADVNRPGNHSLTPLCIACAHSNSESHSEIVTTLIDANADVNLADDTGATPLRIACKKGAAHTVYELIAANADADKPNNRGETPLVAACRLSNQNVRILVVIVNRLLAANADVVAADAWLTNRIAANGANDEGPPLMVLACRHGHAQVVARLLDANGDIERRYSGLTPMRIACEFGHRGCVQVLSMCGANRTNLAGSIVGGAWVHDATAEAVAARFGHQHIVDELRLNRDWSQLHHLEVLTADRARVLLRDAADVVHAAAGAGGPTPLDRAKELCSTGRADTGSAAHVVLEAGAPWSRQTHKYYPPAARKRAAELMWFTSHIKRRSSGSFPIPHEVWEAFVVRHAIASGVWQ